MRPPTITDAESGPPEVERSAAALIDAIVAFRGACREGGRTPPPHLLRQIRREAEDLIAMCLEREAG